MSNPTGDHDDDDDDLNLQPVNLSASREELIDVCPLLNQRISMA